MNSRFRGNDQSGEPSLLRSRHAREGGNLSGDSTDSNSLRPPGERCPARGAAVTAVALFFLGTAARCQEPLETPEPREDLRGRLLLDYDCASDIDRRSISLFANGTIRLRTEGLGERSVRLAELAPYELSGFVNRLAAEDLSETDAETLSPEGDWIERCKLELSLLDRPTETFQLDRYGSLSLALSRVLTVARELGERVERDSPLDRHLPAGYLPKTGDVLERKDGELFRVQGYTADKQGVELGGVEQPLTLYLTADELQREFVAVVSRRDL